METAAGSTMRPPVSSNRRSGPLAGRKTMICGLMPVNRAIDVISGKSLASSVPMAGAEEAQFLVVEPYCESVRTRKMRSALGKPLS